MGKKPKIGIIGAGNWGKNLIREFDKISTVSTCVITKNSKNNTWLKRNYPHINILTSYNSIIKDRAIETVVIATPIKTHFGIAKKSLLAGKHIFIEKPMTVKKSEAKQLVEIAKKQKRIIFVGYIFLYHPIFKKIQTILKKEKLKYLGFDWKKLSKTFEEDIYLNLLSHDISIALALFGNIKKIKAIHTQRAVSNKDIIYAKASSDGHKTDCTFHINRVSNRKEKITTIITDKNVYVWENNLLYKLNKKQNAFVEIYKSKKTPLEIECGKFVKSIKSDEKPATDGEFGLSVQEILEKIK